nr:hypothetical protein [Tanacetum cinerariifolium]
MSNTNTNLQTQTSNTLHNVIIEAGGKDRPPMLAPVAEGSSKTTKKWYMENYKNVSQDIQYQLNAEAKAVQIILTWIDNDIYSTIDACHNACEMLKSIERFVTLVKQSQELKTVSYHKLYDILKQHQHKVNEIRAEKIARVANPFVLVALQQPVYHPQTHPNHYKQNSSTRLQQVATRNRGKAIVNSPQPIYDQEPSMVDNDDETSKDNEIDKLMALISLSNDGYESQRIGNVVGAKETVEQADWKDDTDDESDDQELEAHYMYMAKVQEVSPDAIDYGPIFDTELEQKWKSRIKRYIDTKPNNELIHYCLTNPPYELGWKDKEVPTFEGSLITTTERVHETYKNVSQEIRDQLNAEAEAVQIILTGIDNDIYSTVDACPNACEMWKAIERLKQGSSVVQKSGIQCYNCKEFGHVARECQKLKRAKDAAYHREKMLLCKQEEAGIQSRTGTHYMYMAQLQEVSPDAADSGPIFDDEPLQK